MAKDKVKRAGVIPYIVKDNQIHMLFMQPSDPRYGGPKFQIAKGKVEHDDSTIEEAAFREAKEELGLFVGNVEESASVGEFLGRMTVYVARVKSEDMFGMPDYETGDTKWMTLEQFIKEGRELHVPVVKAAVRTIEKLEKKKA